MKTIKLKNGIEMPVLGFGVCQVAYFIATRAEENSCGKRVIAVTGLWQKGEMNGLLDMKQTNEMGKAV